MYEPPNKFGNASPLLVVGVILLAVSFIDKVIHMDLWLLKVFAIIIIIFGVIHSIYNATTGEGRF